MNACGGNRTAVQDLGGSGEYILIAGEEGQEWVEAARRVASELGLALNAFTVGRTSGDYLDPRCAWLRDRGHTAAGAVLVRPDKFIAFRADKAGDAPDEELRQAFLAIAGRS